MTEETSVGLKDVSQLHKSEVERIVQWSKLARHPRYNRCDEGWSGFGINCFGYHGYFAFLDATGSVSSPRAHEEWYISSLQTATGDQEGNIKPAILISGLATPAMADITVRGVERGTAIDIIDICKTPLLVTQTSLPELKRKHDLRINKLDVLDLAGLLKLAESRGLYSAVVTDAFLTRFPNDEKHLVLENLSRILRSGFGSLITTWRIKDERQDERGYGTEQDRKIFVDNVVAAANKLGIPYTLDEIGAAYNYASTMSSHGGQSIEEIREIVGKHFGDVRIESTWPYNVYDVTMRAYARILARDPMK